MRPLYRLEDVQILERRACYQGFFRLDCYRLRHRLFQGGWSRVLALECLERGDAAAVLLYDPKPDQVVLIEQFRIGALKAPEGPWLLEVVAGMIEPGETPEEVARREALEEAGCEVQRLWPIASYLVSPGGTSERIHLFCGLVDASRAGGIHGKAEEGEDIRVHAVPFEKAWGWVEEGRIQSATPLIALQWLALHRDRLKEET